MLCHFLACPAQAGIKFLPRILRTPKRDAEDQIPKPVAFSTGVWTMQALLGPAYLWGWQLQ